ncbi:MAG: site-2 protease family protein [Dehalococcoidales bacterium]|nr:site-2 protease family protein [Dehalococcoidales bacterium]
MRGSFKLGRIAGIEIGVHYTWLLAFFLIAWSLAQGFFPQQYPGWTVTTYWITGAISAILLFVSVLLHELAHSMVATARGMRVQGITLFIFGGVSNIETEPEKPGVEFLMSVVGPLTSLVLAGVFWAIQQAVADRSSPPAALLYYLMLINALLAAFNIIPGFPLDGGRVLRSIIWGATGSLTKATNVAATTGRIFGWALIAYGFFTLLSGNFLNGIWIAFIGWFLSSAADSSRQEVTMQQHLSGMRVNEVMNTAPECVNQNATVESLVRESFIQHGLRAAPICVDGQLTGIVTLTDVRKIPQENWSQTSVSAVMTRSPLYTVKQDDDLNTAVKLLAQHGLNQVPVLDDKRLVGLLSRADVIRFLQLSRELGMKPKATPPGKMGA